MSLVIQEWNGKVIRKAEDINEQTQSISVYVSINNNNNRPIYKGQYLKANFHGIPSKKRYGNSKKCCF